MGGRGKGRKRSGEESRVLIRVPLLNNALAEEQSKRADNDSNFEEQEEIIDEDSLCVYCSTTTITIKHHHVSTAQQRALAIKNSNGSHLCCICKVLEPVTILSCSTRRILLTDGTMFGIWNSPSLPSVAKHFEMECVVKGRVRDLKRALDKNILYMPNRVEIIVIGGLENIGDGEDPEQVLAEFSDLKTLVKEHSERKGHNPPSTVSISTLCLAPKYCSFGTPKDPEWIPPPGFINRYPAIKKVNEGIKSMNEEENLSWVNVHFHGVKLLKSGPQHKFDTRPGTKRIWREKDVFSKMHFTMENKINIARYAMTTFEVNEKPNPKGK